MAVSLIGHSGLGGRRLMDHASIIWRTEQRDPDVDTGWTAPPIDFGQYPIAAPGYFSCNQ